MNNLTIVIPVYNEADSLEHVLDDLNKFVKKTGVSVIIVDDASGDDSLEIIQTNSFDGLKVLKHKLNRGYGGALKTGLSAVESEFAITLDGDGQHYLEDVEKLYKKILATDADMIVGSRKGQKEASWFRKFGKFMIRSLAKCLMHVPIYDINSGMKIYRTDLMKNYLSLCPDTMAFSDIITLIFINNRHLVLEESIKIKSRLAGVSKIGVKSAYHTVMEIINMMILFHPMKVFLPVSIVIFTFGLMWSLYFMITKQVITTGGSFFMISGILIFLLGLITEQLAQIRRTGTK